MGKPKGIAATKQGGARDKYTFDEDVQEEKNQLAEVAKELRGHLSKGTLDKSATLKTLKVRAYLLVALQIDASSLRHSEPCQHAACLLCPLSWCAQLLRDLLEGAPQEASFLGENGGTIAAALADPGIMQHADKVKGAARG